MGSESNMSNSIKIICNSLGLNKHTYLYKSSSHNIFRGEWTNKYNIKETEFDCMPDNPDFFSD